MLTMRVPEKSETVQVPTDVKITLREREVKVTGPKGILTRKFSHEPVSIELAESAVRVRAEWPRKKEAALVGTVASHIQNMITGVTKGFTYKLKVVFSHFPISVKLKEKTVLIENFTGERNPRKAKIIGDAKVKIEGEDVIVQGINLEDVSQTAANVEQATKVKRKDPRIFLDGLYVFEQVEGM
jgi:large subunit ribosomal protein L6